MSDFMQHVVCPVVELVSCGFGLCLFNFTSRKDSERTDEAYFKSFERREDPPVKTLKEVMQEI